MDQLVTHAELRGDPTYPCPVSLQHVSIFSGSNYSKMVEFYQTLLNMRITYEIENEKLRFTALSFDEDNHRIGMVYLPELAPRPRGSARIEHTSWNYADLPTLLETIKVIEARSGLFPMAVHQGVIIAVSYQDPDTNRVELTIECLGGQAEIIAFYTEKLHLMPDFNTIQPFDLRKMLKLYDEGEKIENLMDYNWVREHLPPVDQNARPF